LPHVRKLGRLTLVIGGSMLGLLLAACSSSPPPATSTATTVPRGAGGTTMLPGATPAPFHQAKNAHADVKVTGPCTHTSDGSWVLNGTVTNASSDPTGYTIVVDYVQIPGNTVFDTQIVTVPPVDPKHTVPWSASWKYANNDVTCVVRQSQTS
jgi:hypothetical protein